MSSYEVQPEELEHLSFPDAQILQQKFSDSPSLRQLIIHLDGSYLNSGNQKGQLGKGYLKLYDWHQVIVHSYDHRAHKWLLVPSLSKYLLKNICEFIINQKLITFRGFCVTTGLWTEWVFWETKISGIFDNN